MSDPPGERLALVRGGVGVVTVVSGQVWQTSMADGAGVGGMRKSPLS
jgi:hypothetical protein